VKLHSPEFERRLRRAVKRAVRGSPALRRDAKRGRRPRHYSALPLLRLFMSSVPALLVWNAYGATHHLAPCLVVLNGWLILMALFRASHLFQCLFQAPDRFALLHLPISDDDVFRWERQKFILASIFTAVDILVVYVLLAALVGMGWVAWLAVGPLALVTALAHAGLAALLAAHLAHWVLFGRLLAVLFSFVLVVATRLVRYWDAALGMAWVWLDGHATWFNTLLPTGWAVSVFGVLDPATGWRALPALLLIAVLIGSLGPSFRRLRAGFAYREIAAPEAPDLLPEEEAAEWRATHTPDALPRVGVTAIAELVEERRLFAPPAWPERGWLERGLWKWLTERERALADFAFVHGLALTQGWRKVFRNLLIGLALGFAASLRSPAPALWLLGLTLVVAGIQVLALVYASGSAFGKIASSGVFIPYCAVYPVGFRELSRLLVKYTLVQFPLLAAFSLTASLGIHRLVAGAGFVVLPAAVMGLKAAGLLAAARFPLVALGLSACTNDSARIRLRSLLIIFGFILFGLPFLGLGAASLFVPHAGWAALSYALAIASAYALLRMYGWFYHTNRIDLMSERPQ
jgi:hypothetical protein